MSRRTYKQFCGLARALDVVGERWTLLLVRNLLLGPRRYSDLLAELPGITTNLLAKRLAELEAHGLVTKALQGASGVTAYALTEGGRELEPAVHALAAWGKRHMGRPRRDDTLNLGWAMLSLKRRYRGGVTGSVAFLADGRRYTLRFSPTAMHVSDVDTLPADAEITADRDAILGVMMLGQAPARKRFSVAGDRDLFMRVVLALREA